MGAGLKFQTLRFLSGREADQIGICGVGQGLEAAVGVQTVIDAPMNMSNVFPFYLGGQGVRVCLVSAAEDGCGVGGCHKISSELQAHEQ